MKSRGRYRGEVGEFDSWTLERKEDWEPERESRKEYTYGEQLSNREVYTTEK